MYEIGGESVRTFITDKNIRLPRFQRKQTWNDKKNFELCISLFKDYPLGVVIVNVEQKNGISIRWLLDGRQRRHALVKMYEDPENIYEWAMQYIKFNNNSQPDEIRKMFKKTIDGYVEYDEDEKTLDQLEETGNDIDNDTIDFFDGDSDSDYEDTQTKKENAQSNKLDFLLDLILMVHNKSDNSSRFSQPFDIREYVERLPYLGNVNGTPALSSKNLKTFIDQYRDDTENKYSDYAEKINPESFYSFVDSRMNIKNADGLKKYIKNNWEDIKYRIDMMNRLDSILSSSKIGIIEVKEIKFADSQKIFNIINTKGEKLSAVEVLSAKPSWNVQININGASSVMQESVMQETVADFYKTIGINVEKKIVKWDLPATLLKRIGNNFIFKSFDTSKVNDLSKSLTYGFKLLSGVWENGIKKDDIDKLSKDRRIDWQIHYETLVKDFQTMLKVIESFPYFKFFKSWHTSLMEITNDSIALNFFILAYKEWERKGKPQKGSGSNTKPFVKNCFVLWDKLIFEYLSLKWKGSGDSKIGKNIADLQSAGFLFTSIQTKDWVEHLEEIHKTYTVFGEKINPKNMKPILYHFYCLKAISGPDTHDIEVDHIIPQEAFKNATIPINPNALDSLYNLGLLPKGENISKSNKRLNDIHDSWLKDQIKKYEFIEESEFDEFSDVANYQRLFDVHYELFKNVFSEGGDREKILYN